MSLDFDIPDYMSDPLVQMLQNEGSNEEADVLVSCYRSALHRKATEEVERLTPHDHINIHVAFPYH